MALNANALVTLALAKSYLKIPTADTTQDSIVELWINAASDLFEGETDRKIKSQSHIEYQSGRRQNILIFKEYPVTSITSVKVDNTAQFSGNETTLDTADYTIGDNGNSLFLLGFFASGNNNIKLTYTAGYSPVPSDIQNAVLWMITYYHKMRENGDIGRTNKGKGDESITILQELPQDVKNCINRYKRSEIPIMNTMARNG